MNYKKYEWIPSFDHDDIENCHRMQVSFQRPLLSGVKQNTEWIWKIKSKTDVNDSICHESPIFAIFWKLIHMHRALSAKHSKWKVKTLCWFQLRQPKTISTLCRFQMMTFIVISLRHWMIHSWKKKFKTVTVVSYRLVNEI